MCFAGVAWIVRAASRFWRLRIGESPSARQVRDGNTARHEHGIQVMSRPNYRILHVDDSADDAELVRLALDGAPFASSVSRVETEAGYVAGLAGGSEGR